MIIINNESCRKNDLDMAAKRISEKRNCITHKSNPEHQVLRLII